MAKRTDSTAKVIPIEKAAPALTEMGATGLKHWQGRIADELLRDLQSSDKRYKFYREIRDNSAVVGAAMLAIEQLLRQRPRDLEPGGEAAEDRAAHKFVQECLDDLGHPACDIFGNAKQKLTYGWALSEIVYKRRSGERPESSGVPSSMFTDGKYGWHKFAPRSQESLDQWIIEDGSSDVLGFAQCPAPKYQRVVIPASKYLLWNVPDGKDSPEGRSLLRNCVFPWRFVKRIMEIEGIGIERDLAGLPVAWAPAEVVDGAATGNNKQIQDALKKLVSNLRRDEQEGVLFPLEYTSTGEKRYDLTLLSTGGTRQFDTGAVVMRYEQRIAQTMLADFILLGHEKVGSFSLSSDKTDLFAVAIAGFDDADIETFNRYAIPRLLRLNGMKGKPPRIKGGDIEKEDLKNLADALDKLVNATVLTPDEDLEREVRRRGGLPMPEVEDLPTAEERKPPEPEPMAAAPGKPGARKPGGKTDASVETA